jgi:hypothetical protein
LFEGNVELFFPQEEKLNFRDPSGYCPDKNGDGICDTDWSPYNHFTRSIKDPATENFCVLQDAGNH